MDRLFIIAGGLLVILFCAIVHFIVEVHRIDVDAYNERIDMFYEQVFDYFNRKDVGVRANETEQGSQIPEPPF